MTVIINGTTGITNVNGSAAAPAETGTDTDTGIVYGTNTLSLATGGTAALTANSSQGIQVLNTIGVGNATPSTSGAGITFPSTNLHYSTNANTLDDYEEGTWTPGLISDSTDVVTYSFQNGYYRKIGSQVTVWFAVQSSSIPSGSILRFSGLPFSVNMSNTGYQNLNSGGPAKTPIYLETYTGTNNQAFANASGYANPTSYNGVSIGGVYTYIA